MADVEVGLRKGGVGCTKRGAGGGVVVAGGGKGCDDEGVTKEEFCVSNEGGGPFGNEEVDGTNAGCWTFL